MVERMRGRGTGYKEAQVFLYYNQLLFFTPEIVTYVVQLSLDTNSMTRRFVDQDN